MPFDIATLSLELDTTGLARGARQVDSILTGIERRFDQTLRRIQQINKTINTAFNFAGGNAKAAQAFGQTQAQFQQHQAKLQQIAAQGAQRQQAIAAQAAARLQQIQAQSAAQQQTIAARLQAQQQAAALRAARSVRPQATGINRLLNQSSLVRESGESLGNAGVGLTLLTDKFIALGRAAVRSAFDIDKNVSTLKAFLGSTAAAESRLTQLVNLSQKTPGLTSSLASTLDAQLRTTNVKQGTIDRILPAIGRLNAVSPLGDPQKFAQNLQQLVTQGFERADLKELVGQSPIAGQIIAELFNVDSPTNGKAIREAAKKLGIKTTDDFFAAFAEAASKNRALAGVTESLETRFQKLSDRISIAIRPLGLAIVKAFEPIVEKAIPFIEKLSKAFNELPEGTKTAIVAFTALTAVIGPALIALGALVQSLGAVGGLLKAGLALGGASGAAGAGAALGGIATALGVITVAVAGLYVAWRTNWAGIRDITSDVGREVIGIFGEMRDFWAEIAPDFKAIIGPSLSAVADLFRFYSGTIGAVWRNLWDFIKITVREALDVLKPVVSGTLALLRGDFEQWGRESNKIWKEAWDFVLLLPANVFNTLLKVVEDGLTNLLTTSGFAKNIGLDIGKNLGQGIVDGFIEIAASKSTAIAIRGFLETIRGNNSQRDAARQAQREASAGRGLDGEEITSTQLAQNVAFLNQPKAPKVPGLGIGSGRGSGSSARSRAESEARSIRAAEEELAKAKAAAIETIQTRSLQSQLKAEEDNFEKRIIGAEAFFEARKKIELELLSLTERRIKAEAAASSKRLLATKDGSPEELRELAQLVGLQSQLRIVEVERTDKVKDLNAELEKNLKLERERRAETLRTVAGSVGEGLSKVGEQIQGIQRAQLEKPSVELRKEEIRLQGLANAGLIREGELQDALTLARRAARSELIHSLEVEKESLDAGQDAGRFSRIQQIEEEILAMQSLGSELTRAEALQRRFAEQGILDYDRLNDGLLDLLASQKGVTEIFSDFRANTVADGFGLIETGIDKLTKRLGILGDAFGQLLKDLAKLAVSKILQKLLGIGGGQSSSFGIGGAGAARSTSPLSGLGSLITGGGGNASGGGGIGGLLTGGFAGGNPAQAAIGGGSGGGGGVLGSIFSGGQGSGGGSPLGGLLSKIPGVGKLFGSGGGGQSLIGGIGTNIGSLPGGIQGVGSLPLTGPGAGGLSASGSPIGGAGALGSFGGLAAGGLIAGGGLLGSLAGGKSQVGQLLGGVGGSLLGGSAAAALFNPALLPALFSNPITAIIGGALIGGALLFRFLGGREQRKFRKTVESEYALKVDGKEKGTELYKAIKGLGEEKFGKGKFGKNMVETIRLSKAQEALAAYGEATGQENNPLVRKFRDRKELTNPFDSRNEFIKRANGGDVRANQPYIVGDGGRSEVFVPSTSGQIYPSIAEFMREIVRPQSAQPTQSGGGWTGEAKETLRAMMAVNVRLVEALNRFESLPPEEVVRVAARRDPDTIAHANLTSIQNNSTPGRGQLNEFRKGR